MLLNQRRVAYLILAGFSFILGCTLTLFFVHSTAFPAAANTSPKVPGLKVLVLVVSAVKNIDRRDAIRETWARGSTAGDVRVLFVASRDQYLVAEKLVHDDVLEVDVADEYRLLSRKLLEAMRVVVGGGVNFEYLLKCDDDTFVDVPKLVGELDGAPKNRFYWGYFDGNAHIKRAGKWKETDWILCDRYLPYALGGGYVLSSDLVEYIVNNRHYLR